MGFMASAFFSKFQQLTIIQKELKKERVYAAIS
jgi:hypothetical protein